MRILAVGGTGTVGRAVSIALEERGHEVIRVGYDDGDHFADIADPAAVEALYETVGAIDAVVCTAGVAIFGALADLDDAAFRTSIENKMMGQVNLVRSGLARVAEGGSFTLTTGTLSTKPAPGTVAVAMVSAAVEGFVRAAALDLEGGRRINAVSPSHVAESRIAAGLEPMPGIWAKDLAEYYVHCVEGDVNGMTFEAEAPMS